MKLKQKHVKEVKHTRSDPQKVLQSFLSDRDVAPWFRGTSIFHLQGSDELLNAIRDDMEQKTTHRVRNCLTLIGLDPMITSKDIALLMRMCKGNDLAFLWFLLETRYKIPDSTDVGLNEQLICSAIAHLDMITTLRELDKILPSYQPPQGKGKRVQQPSNKSARLLTEETKRQPYSPKYVLPYFEKQRRPKVYGESLNVDLPNFKVDFHGYASYKDPNHKVSNETNRWFADYDFHPGRRVASVIIKDAISEIFQNLEAAKLKADTIQVLCKHHRKMKQLEDNLEHELLIQLRDKIIFGNKNEKRKHRLRHTKETLHSAIEQQLCEFRKQTNVAKREFTLKILTSESNITNVIVGSEYDDCCSKLSRLADDKSGVPKGLNNGAGDASAATPADRTVKHNSGAGDFANNPPDVDKVKNIKKIPCTIRSPSQLSVFASKYLKNLDYGHMGNSPSPSQTFFYANSEHRPLQFDYRKIFLFKNGNENDTQKCVKEAFLEALDKDISTLTELEVAQTNLNSAASECASNTWQTELARYNSEHQHDTEILVAKSHNDPEDKKLMDQMLSDAFEILRKNPKFVLAQLPDAHKLPVLREWIYRRYGKVYTPQQKHMSCEYSLKVFQALHRMSFDFRAPTTTDLGCKPFVPYDCRNYLAKKVTDVKSKFNQRMDNAIMERSRNYWFAMRGYLCSNGPPRQTFFAYMPSRLGDIQHFRPWKTFEHRPDKEKWEQRFLFNKRR